MYGINFVISESIIDQVKSVLDNNTEPNQNYIKIHITKGFFNTLTRLLNKLIILEKNELNSETDFDLFLKTFEILTYLNEEQSREILKNIIKEFIEYCEKNEINEIKLSFGTIYVNDVLIILKNTNL